MRREPLTIDQALDEWHSKRRHMGCVSASAWFCARVEGFRPERLARWTEDGHYFEHQVATDGRIRVDLTPQYDAPDES